jgi:hypothetical protein
MRPKILRFVQEKARNMLEVVRIDKDFLNRTPAAQQLRERMDKWDFLRLKTSAQQKNGL